MPDPTHRICPVVRHPGHNSHDILHNGLPQHIDRLFRLPEIQQHPGGEVVDQGTVLHHPSRHDLVARLYLRHISETLACNLRADETLARFKLRDDLRRAAHENQQNRADPSRQQEAFPHEETHVHVCRRPSRDNAVPHRHRGLHRGQHAALPSLRHKVCVHEPQDLVGV